MMTWLGFRGYYKVTEEYTPDEQPTKTTREYQPGKTLWDALTLLLLPFILTGGVIYFGMRQSQDNLNLTQNQFHVAATQYVNDKSIAATRYANDQQLALESTFQTYLDRMTDLITNPHVHESSPLGDDIRSMATARTLTILPDLSVPRKTTVMKFLHDAGLINRPKSPNIKDPIVNLNGADFSGVDLSGFVLGGANLPIVNLNSAILSGADLSGAYLPKANLRGANLHQAILCSTQFIGRPDETTNLSGAILSDAHLSGANLIGADLSNADLSGANLGTTDQICSALLPPGKSLIGADLSNANLKGANISNTDFTGVKWKNTTCPDGTNSDTNGSNSCVGH
jgi:uncharacterized protein YjbI with pentapeptide repeats